MSLTHPSPVLGVGLYLRAGACPSYGRPPGVNSTLTETGITPGCLVWLHFGKVIYLGTRWLHIRPCPPASDLDDCEVCAVAWDLGGSFKTVTMTSVTTLYSEVNLVLSILSPQRQVILQYIQQETFSPVHNA